jgi:hypothetical protein
MKSRMKFKLRMKLEMITRRSSERASIQIRALACGTNTHHGEEANTCMRL